jgi:membrane protease YdiL (CAAX protease family)
VVFRTIQAVFATSLMLSGALASEAPEPLDDFTEGSHERLIDRVNTAQSASYSGVLAGYDHYLSQFPGDYLQHIERCRFIENFAYSEENVIASASDDLTACRDSLNEGDSAGKVAVQLYGLENTWGEEGVARGEQLLSRSGAWTPEERVRLFEMLSQRVEDEERRASYAFRALELDPGSSVLMTAVNRWIQVGAKDKALRLLRDAPESTWAKVPRATAAQALIDLGDAKGAASLLRAADKLEEEYEGGLTLARALAAAEDYAAAREQYKKEVAREYASNDTRAEWFRFEASHGTAEQALAAYQQLRDQGYWADPLARQRLALLVSSPGAPWQARDLLGLLTLLGLGLAFCLVPLAVVVPVHYRGLARRVRDLPPDLGRPAWTLRHAAWALGAFLMADFIAMYIFAPAYLEYMLPGSPQYTNATTTDLLLGRYMVTATLLMLLFILPLMRGRSPRDVLLGQWSIGRHIIAGVGILIALKIATGIVAVVVRVVSPEAALGSDTTRAIQGMTESFGIGVTLLMVAGITPLVEEFIFRGVLLQAFRGQVSFWVSAVFTSLVFTLLHEEWVSMPYLFVFAMSAALLARNSGGLLASIVLHVINNAMAVLVIVGATSIINR